MSSISFATLSNTFYINLLAVYFPALHQHCFYVTSSGRPNERSRRPEMYSHSVVTMLRLHYRPPGWVAACVRNCADQDQVYVVLASELGVDWYLTAAAMFVSVCSQVLYIVYVILCSALTQTHVSQGGHIGRERFIMHSISTGIERMHSFAYHTMCQCVFKHQVTTLKIQYGQPCANVSLNIKLLH